MRILIADDHALLRQSLRGALDTISDFQVVAEADSSHSCLQQAQISKPDIVLLDITMPGRDALETIGDLLKLDPGMGILMCTAQPNDVFAVRFLKAGARGYFRKTGDFEDLIHAIRRIGQGGRYISLELAEQLAASLVDEDSGSPHDRLSGRELQVLRLIATGQTTSDIAAELFLSPKTVSTYRTRILEKLDLKTTADLILYALRAGLTEHALGPESPKASEEEG